MPIEIINISDKESSIILSLEEGHFADLKGVGIAPAKLTKSLSAFANADGGELFIGIDEDTAAKTRAWNGFPNAEAANGHLQPFEKLFPLSQEFEYQFLRHPALPGLVLKATIAKTHAVKFASDGRAYVRRGAASLPVESPEALKRLEYAKGITSFETELVNGPLEEICNSRSVIEFMLQVVPTGEPEVWLRKQQLIREGKPTVAATLLFAEEPQALLPKRSGVKIYRYKTTDIEGSIH